MVDSSNQAWLNSIWDLALETPIGAEHYYENTIKLLTMIVMSANRSFNPTSVSSYVSKKGTP